MSDPFTAYPARVCGWGYGIGEALRGPFGPPVARLCYAMATGFIFGHTLYKPYVANRNSQSVKKVIVSAGDTFVYEAVASGIVPGFTAFTVKRIIVCGASCSSAMRLWLPSLVALASLPVVCVPADYLWNSFMDDTIRKLY
ncbi:mitochondrial fission process protein 1 [Aplysia californica]|uniref:Mitochondrial fission process protein 1 n=1 Tax=Aplysia californica TaxID=6500 RepID=A0ABM1A7V9_APLCA|nr:mitochondrial fission process protein 1 [Aplysia californica]